MRPFAEFKGRLSSSEMVDEPTLGSQYNIASIL